MILLNISKNQPALPGYHGYSSSNAAGYDRDFYTEYSSERQALDGYIGPRLEPIGLDSTVQATRRTVAGQEALYIDRANSSTSNSSNDSMQNVPLSRDDQESNPVLPDGRESVPKDLTQYPIQDFTYDSRLSTLSQHSLHTTGASSLGPRTRKDVNYGPSRRSTFEVIVQSRISDYNLTSSHCTATKDSLTQYPLDDVSFKSSDDKALSSQTFSQLALSGLNSAPVGVASKHMESTASSQSSDPIAMFSTRPGTAIEQEPASTSSQPDNEPPDAKKYKLEHYLADSDKIKALLRDTNNSPMTSDSESGSMNLASSIKFQHKHHESTLGDTLLGNLNDPIFASTPAVHKGKAPISLRDFRIPLLELGPTAGSGEHSRSHSGSASPQRLPTDHSPRPGDVHSVGGTQTQAHALNVSAPGEEYAASAEVFYPLENMDDPSFSPHANYDPQYSQSPPPAGGPLYGAVSAAVGEAMPGDGSSSSTYSPPNRDAGSIASSGAHQRLAHGGAEDFESSNDSGADSYHSNAPSNASRDKSHSSAAALSGYNATLPERPPDDILAQFETRDAPDIGSVAMWTTVNKDLSSHSNGMSSPVRADLGQHSGSASPRTSLQGQGEKPPYQPMSYQLPNPPATETRLPKKYDPNADRQSPSSMHSHGFRSEGSLSEKVAAILANAPPNTVGSDAESVTRNTAGKLAGGPLDSQPVLDSEEEELARMTSEYRAVLKERLGDFTDTESNISNPVVDSRDGKKVHGESMASTTSQDKYSRNRMDASDTVEIVKTVTGGKAEYSGDHMQNKSSGSDTDDSLDVDVRKILAKYGRSLSDSDNESSRRGSAVSRNSPTGSVSESEDMSHRVNKLLYGKPGDQSHRSMDTGSLLSAPDGMPAYLMDDPSQSMSLPRELQSAVSHESIPTAPQGLKFGNLRDNESRRPGATGNTSDKPPKLASVSSDDTITGKVQELLGATEYIVDADVESDASSRHSSRTGSLAGSVDLENMEKDLDEMEVEMESLKKSSEGGSRRGSEISQKSTASSKGSTRGNADVQMEGLDRNSISAQDVSKLSKESEGSYGFIPVGGEQASQDRPASGRHGSSYSSYAADQRSQESSYFQKSDQEQPERKRATHDPGTSYKTDLGTHALLTSGVIPMEMALDMIHGYGYSPNRNQSRNRDPEVGPSYRSSYDAAQVRRDERYKQTHDGVHYDEGEERELRNYANSSADFDQSYSEKVIGIVERDSPTRQAYEYLAEANRKHPRTTVGMNLNQPRSGQKLPSTNRIRAGNTASTTPENRTKEQSFNVTPVSHAPFSALGNFRSVFSSHMDKVSTSAFDKSIELHRPYLHNKEDSLLQRGNDDDANYPVAIEHDPKTNRYMSLGHGNEASAGSQRAYGSGLSEAKRSLSGQRPVQEPGRTPLPSTTVRGIADTSRQTVMKNMARSTSPALQAANLRPYRPVGSQELYYVESGAEDATSTVSASEATVESTHIGSDDARGPVLPSSVLGSRADSSSSSEGIYHKKKGPGEGLTAIQEQPSMDSRDTESAKSKSDGSEKSKKEEEQERSLRKAQDWVDEIGGDGTPRDPDDKDTPRDNPGSEAQVLQDQIQPQHAVGDKNNHQFQESFEAWPEIEYSGTKYDNALASGQYGKGMEPKFGTPQKTGYTRGGSRNESLSETRQRAENSSKMSDSYRSDVTSPFYSRDKYGSRYPSSSIKLSDESISPVLPQRERLHTSRFNPATSSMNYDQMRSPLVDDSYERSGSRSDRNRNSPLKLRNVSFSPLRPEQDTDELLEADFTEDVPGKSYPPTPHPFTGRVPQDRAASGSRSPGSYRRHTSSRSPGASPGTDQSILSDQMARFEEQSLPQFRITDIRSPGYRRGTKTFNRSPQSLFSADTSGTRPRSRSMGSPRSTTTGSPRSRSPSPRSRYGRMRSWSPFRGSTSGHDRSSATLDLSSGPLTPLATSPTSRVRELSPSHFRNYDEERLQQRMRYIMERLSPGAESRPSQINSIWERFLESRNQSRSETSTDIQSADLSQKVARLLDKSSELSERDGPSQTRSDKLPVRKSDDRTRLNDPTPTNRNVIDGERKEDRATPPVVQVSHDAGKPPPRTDTGYQLDTDALPVSTVIRNVPSLRTISTEQSVQTSVPVYSTAISSYSPSLPTFTSTTTTYHTVPDVTTTAASMTSSAPTAIKTVLPRHSRPLPVSQANGTHQSKLNGHAMINDHPFSGDLQSRTTAPSKETQLSQQIENIFKSTQPMEESAWRSATEPEAVYQAPKDRRVHAQSLPPNTDFIQSAVDQSHEFMKTGSQTHQDNSKPPPVTNTDSSGEPQPPNGNQTSTAKRTAYLIRDEALAVVPEDSTLESISSDFTTSSYESDGKVIMKTTKRHLPADPKLLRLQHKILKQKEKSKHDRLRELKRKERIAKLERVLAERNIIISKSGHRLVSPRPLRTPESQNDATGKPVPGKQPKSTSTPSAPKFVPMDSLSSDSTTLTLSDITSSTMTSMFSEDITLTGDTREEVTPWSVLRNTQGESKQKPARESKSCTCSNAGRASRSKSASPERQQPRTSDDERPVRITRSSGASYLEFDKPAHPKNRRAKSKSPQRQNHLKENMDRVKNRKEIEKHRKEAKEEQNVRARSREKSIVDRRKAESLSEGKRDFGQTCPTPISASPAREVIKQNADTVTMVSQGIQTQSFIDDVRHRKENQRNVYKSLGSSKAGGMFTPDGSLHLVRNTNDADHTQKGNNRNKPSFSAGQSGLSWFVPMGGSKPWRKPLRERQPNTVPMDTWSALDSQVSTNLRDLEMGINKCAETNKYPQPSHSSGTHRDGSHKGSVGATSLQEAFDRKMQDFVSQSRERQRVVSLRAEERRIQDLHDAERERLFAVKRKLEANLHAVPISEMHFKPQRRKFSKKEMKKQTEKKYKKLPEVVQKAASQRKMEGYQTNRLKAKLYNKKIQDQILNRRNGYY